MASATDLVVAPPFGQCHVPALGEEPADDEAGATHLHKRVDVLPQTFFVELELLGEGGDGTHVEAPEILGGPCPSFGSDRCRDGHLVGILR